MNIKEIKEQYLNHGGTETLRSVIINSGAKPETTDKMLYALADWWISKFIEREEELYRLMEEKKWNMEERHKQLCRDTSKTNRRLNMRESSGFNKGIEKCQTLLSLTRKDI